MEQLELFDTSSLSSQSKFSKTYTDWEADTKDQLFDNRDHELFSPRKETVKPLFDNKGKLSELAVSEYQPGGTASRNNKYYRFSYRDGKRIRHLHIKGGNITSPLAISRKEKVELWILQPLPLKEIIRRIKEW